MDEHIRLEKALDDEILRKANIMTQITRTKAELERLEREKNRCDYTISKVRFQMEDLKKSGCDYCQKGSQFQWLPITSTIAVCNYIFGNELRTVIDFSTHQQTNIKRITNCPFCGTELHELPDEEMEEEIDD